MMENFAQGRRTHGNDFPPRLKYVLVLGQYLTDNYHGLYHAKAQNLRHKIYHAYEEVLEDVDVLALPTSAKIAERIEDIASQPLQQYLELGNKPTRTFNTKPFNLTGQPAISIPCGTVDDLPVGLMFAGKRYDDASVLETAAAYEESIGWDIQY
jgi:amidase